MTKSLKVHLALVGAIILWASAFVGIRYGLQSYTPGGMALLRYLIASLCMAGIYLFLPADYPMPWKDRVSLMVIGFFGIGIYNIFLNYGEITISAGVASFLIGLIPVVTAVLSVIFYKESLSKSAWLGIAASLVGLYLIALGEKGHTTLGMGVWFILISVLSGAGYQVVSKRFLSKYHPIAVTAWFIWGGTLLLLIFSPHLLTEIKEADYFATSVIVYMGIFPAALAYLAWSYVLNYLPASRASVFLFCSPLISTLMGSLFLHENPTILALLGGIVAMMGALVAAIKA